MGVSDFFVATLAERLPIYSDQIVNHNVYLNWLREKGRLIMRCGGDGFSFPVRYTDSGLVRAIGDLTVGQAKTAKVAQRISVDYAAYGAELMFSRLQQKRNEYANSTGFDWKFAEESVNELWQDFEDYIGVDLCADGTQGTGDEASPIEGLSSILDTDNTHLGINRTTAANSWWRANTRAVTNNFLDDDDADGVVNGLYYMRLAFLDACGGAYAGDKGISRHVGGSKAKPDLVYTGKTTFVNFCSALQPQQQYTGGQTNDPGAEVAFFGVPVRWDTYATADRLEILNSKVMMVRVVGDKLIYIDNEGELGFQGAPRAHAVGLVSQLQHLCTRPSLCSFVTNTD